MKRSELVTFVRSQIDWLKKLGVPELMRAGDVVKLYKISDRIAYTVYDSDWQGPLCLTTKELGIKQEEEYLAVVFYIWGSPLLDEEFFDNWEIFVEQMEMFDTNLSTNIALAMEQHNITMCSLSELIGLEYLDASNEW